MTCTERAVAYFGEGFNCSQSVCAAFAEELGVDRDTALKFSAGFGGGMGRMGNTCGVVTGAYMALGLKYGFIQASPGAKAAMYDKIRDFSERFRSRHPEGLTCRELLGCDISIHEEHVQAQQAGLFKTLCPQFVRDASEILEAMLGIVVSQSGSVNACFRSPARGQNNGGTGSVAAVPRESKHVLTLLKNMDIVEILPAEAPMELLLEADPSREKVDGYLPRSRCFAAKIAERVVGVYVVTPIAPDTYELMNIAVAPDQQQQGIGSILLNHAIATVRSFGARRLELGTGTFGYQLTFYQKAGFRPYAVDRDFFLKHHDEPIYEAGLQLKDMLRLVLDF